MKSDTIILWFKAFCYVVVGAGSAMITSLGQWANSGEWPNKINWVMIITGAAVGGASQLLSFFSSAWSDYRDARSQTKIVPKAVNKTQAEVKADEVTAADGAPKVV